MPSPCRSQAVRLIALVASASATPLAPSLHPTDDEPSIASAILVSMLIGLVVSAGYAVFHSAEAAALEFESATARDQSGWFYAGYGLTSIASPLLAVYLRRFGLAGFGAGMLLLNTLGASLFATEESIGHSFIGSLLARFVAGLGGEGFAVWLQLASTLHYGGSRYEVLSMSVALSVSSGLGSSGGYYLVALLADTVGVGLALWAVVMWCGVSWVALGGYVALWPLLPRTREAVGGDQMSTRRAEAPAVGALDTCRIAASFSAPEYLNFAFILLMVGCFQYTALNFIPEILLANYPALSSTDAAAAVAIIYALVVALSPVLGYALDRASERCDNARQWAMLLGTSLITAAFAILCYYRPAGRDGGELSFMWMMVVLIGVGLAPLESAAYTLCSTLVAAGTPELHRARPNEEAAATVILNSSARQGVAFAVSQSGLAVGVTAMGAIVGFSDAPADFADAFFVMLLLSLCICVALVLVKLPAGAGEVADGDKTASLVAKTEATPLTKGIKQ